MLQYINRKTIRDVVICAALIASIVFLVIFPTESIEAAGDGLALCANVIIPSLFPFLVLSGFVARSGVAVAIGGRLDRVTRLLFGLPGCCAAGMLLSFVGGYPAGAAAIAELVRSRRITRDEGRRMLQFCVCGGPGFVISTVGAGLMNSTALGVVLYAAHIAAALAIGILATPNSARRRAATRSVTAPRCSAAAAFVESVTAACQSLLSMCGFLILFSALLSILDSLSLGDNRLLSVLVACLLEVSCGCVSASGLWLAAPLLLGFAVGFGGLSVHCQIASMLRGTGTMTPRFWITRLAHGVLTAVFTALLLRIVPVTLPVFGSGGAPLVRVFSGGVGLSVFLLLLCGIWLLFVDKRRQVFYNENNI